MTGGASYARYPTYQKTGLDWPSDAPAHWMVKRIRSVVRLNPSKSEVAGLNREMPVSFLPMEAIGDDGILRLETTRPIGELASGYTYFRDGDVTIAKITPCYENGKGAIMRGLVNGLGFGTTELIVVRPDPSQVTSEFLHYVFTSPIFRKSGESYMYGAGGQKRVPDDFVRNFALALPSPTEQRRITAFLDRETAKIDTLVAEQRRLLGLLTEKRQAVISHAVTKGLNPDAPIKPSGIESVGDVPEHWDILPLKRDLVLLTSGSRGWAENYADEGDLFIRIANLTRDSIGLDLTDVQRVSVPEGIEGSRTKLQAGDVLFSITAYLGSVAVVPESLEDAYVSQHVALARLSQDRLSPRWVGYVTLSQVGRTWFETQSYGGTKIQLSLDDVRNLPITAPPLTEQRKIVTFIEAQHVNFALLTSEAMHAINLLTERKASLISEAVTGQIDVRDLGEPAAA